MKTRKLTVPEIINCIAVDKKTKPDYIRYLAGVVVSHGCVVVDFVAIHRGI